MALSWVVALLLGGIQGVLEWLPISSEGAVSLVLTTVLKTDPFLAVKLSLFLHLGTAVAATGYYRREILDLLETAWSSRFGLGGRPSDPDVGFLVVGSLVSGVVGVAVYAVLESVLTGLPTSAFLLAIGLLLLGTGILQKVGEGRIDPGERRPTVLDGALVGIGQGLALLPGVSRSGTTISILLLREYETEQSLALSFLLAIPASVGAAVLVVLDTGGFPAVAAGPAIAALLASVLVGYVTIGALVGLVRRTPFWLVCIVFGAIVVATALR